MSPEFSAIPPMVESENPANVPVCHDPETGGTVVGRGRIDQICISFAKGTVKTPTKVPRELVADSGIAGDAHAGPGLRQVSLLAAETVEAFVESAPAVRALVTPGAFAENLLTRGIDLNLVAPGDRLIIEGGGILEVTMIGKQCHNDGCAIKRATGECIMPKAGVFCKVVTGGPVFQGNTVKVVKKG